MFHAQQTPMGHLYARHKFLVENLLPNLNHPRHSFGGELMLNSNASMYGGSPPKNQMYGGIPPLIFKSINPSF